MQEDTRKMGNCFSKFYKDIAIIGEEIMDPLFLSGSNREILNRVGGGNYWKIRSSVRKPELHNDVSYPIADMFPPQAFDWRAFMIERLL